MLRSRGVGSALPMLNALLVLAACGPVQEEQTNTAPVIANLIYQPNLVSTQDTFEILCSVDYEDPEGDVKSMDFEYTLPDSSVHESDGLELANEYGVKVGTANFKIVVNVTNPGDYLVELWLVDEQKNLSNRLAATITARE